MTAPGRRACALTRRWRPAARLAVAAVLVVLLATGCGGDDPAVTTTEGTTAPTTTVVTATSPSTTSSSTSTTTSSSSSSSSTMLPGEAIFSYPDEGDALAVMGVDHDDVLNVRAVPGADAEVVATLAPTADDAVATGRARKLTRTIWYEVTVGGVTGWANSSYLGFMEATDDVTAAFLAGDDPPAASTLEVLGELAADHFAPDDQSEPGLRIVQSIPASTGDPAEIGYDVIGIADDSVAGYRLHVFATSTADGTGFVLRSIERSTFCWRGISGGVCV